MRGRKFYLHNPAACAASPEEGCRAVERTTRHVKAADVERLGAARAVRSNQNVTAAILPRGGVFEGTLEFDSLQDHELGLLLWAVSLSDSPLDSGAAQRAHKLGLGKPLGLGSVQVTVTQVVTEEPTEGWVAGGSAGTSILGSAEAERLVRAFKGWMMTGGPTDDAAIAQRFDDLPFVRELCAVLRVDLAANASVTYGPIDVPTWEGYRYFVKQRQRRENGAEEPLRSPTEIAAGARQKHR